MSFYVDELDVVNRDLVNDINIFMKLVFDGFWVLFFVYVISRL